MKKHQGMKSQDIVILLYICQFCDGSYKLVDVSEKLKISLSEVSESLNRSRLAKLIGHDKVVFRNALFDFIVYGLKYVFPAFPGSITRGVPTSHSTKPLSDLIVQNNDNYVWSHPRGKKRGMVVTPLYKTVPDFCMQLPEFHETLALVDAIRIGQIREVNFAIEILKKQIIENAK